MRILSVNLTIDNRWFVRAARFPTRVTVEVKLTLGTTLRNVHKSLLKVRSSSIRVKVEVSQDTQYKNGGSESSRARTRFFNDIRLKEEDEKHCPRCFVRWLRRTIKYIPLFVIYVLFIKY